MQHTTESLQFANDRPTSLSDDLYQWSVDAEEAIRKLVEQLDVQAGSIEAVQAANVRLAAERDALAKDAARYRWLRENKLAHNGHCQSLRGPILWSVSLDEAVDIEMNKETL